MGNTGAPRVQTKENRMTNHRQKAGFLANPRMTRKDSPAPRDMPTGKIPPLALSTNAIASQENQMATKPRERSESGFYHVFHRGVNHFDIFEDDIDRKFYLNRLQRYAKEGNVEIHAWCLMSNHVHLLVRSSLEDLSALMMKLGSVYARWFNKRHERTGSLFGSRFSSVCVETDAQLLAVTRYIHRNPIHHHASTPIDAYRWSSFREYTSGSASTCEIDFLLSVFGGVENLIEFHEKTLPSELERHLDIDTSSWMNDDEARLCLRAALRELGLAIDASHIGSLPKKLRNEAIAFAKRATGCSLRQLQRLTALPYSTLKTVSSHADKTLGGKDSGAQFRDEPPATLKAVPGIGFLETGNPLPSLAETGTALAR